MPHAILNPAMHLSHYIPWKATLFSETEEGKIIGVQYRMAFLFEKINHILSK